MRVLAFGLLGTLTACGGDFAGGDYPSCESTISITPSTPQAGPTTVVRAAVLVDADVDGVRNYSWSVIRDNSSVAFTNARLDGSEIEFIADVAGLYTVDLDLQVAGYACNGDARTVTIVDSLTTRFVRLHIAPSPNAEVPPHEQVIEVPNGSDFDLQTVSLDPGTLLDGTISGSTGGVAAYLRFSPVGSPDATVEAFADAAGAYSVRLAKVEHDVLVVPEGGLPPVKRKWRLGDTGAFVVENGYEVEGTVRDAAGAVIAGAKVQAFVGDVPSTLATTDSAGHYSVQLSGDPAPIRLQVVPPQSTGLPRLEGAVTASSPIDVRYSSALVSKSLAGMVLRRDGNALPNAKITVVGEVPSAGTIGGTDATGLLRISATANASGALPTTSVIGGQFKAVIAASPTDVAVINVNLTSTVPSAVNAPAMLTVATPVVLGSEPLDGARVELAPTGPLALAGMPSIYLTADGNGVATGQAASGGAYDLLVSDPYGRAGSWRAPVELTAPLTSTLTLPAPVYVTGEVKVVGNPNSLAGAAIQILCAACEGIDRARPLAETVTDQAGVFTLAVPKPDPL